MLAAGSNRIPRLGRSSQTVHQLKTVPFQTGWHFNVTLPTPNSRYSSRKTRLKFTGDKLPSKMYKGLGGLRCISE